MEGYDKVPSLVPSVPAHDISSAEYDRENIVAHALAALAYEEIVTYSLNGLPPGPHAVEILNPLSEDQRYLRESLIPGLLEYCARIDAPVRVFEIGHVFARDESGIAESAAAAFAFTAEPLDDPPWRDSHFLRLKGDCEAFLRKVTGCDATAAPQVCDGFHPGKTATMTVAGRNVATLGRIDPRLAHDFDVRLPVYICRLELEALPEYAVPRYHPPSRFPSTYRDLALVVGLDVSAADVEATTARALGSICTHVRVFDEYRGPQAGQERKSLAIRVTLARFDTTITDEEADVAIARALEALRADLGATIRQ